MKLVKMKKLLMAAVLGVFAVGMTGCGMAMKGEVVLTSGSAADYSMSAGCDDGFFAACADALKEMGESSMDAAAVKEQFKGQITAQGGVISEEVIDGAAYTMATMSQTGASFSTIENALVDDYGMTNVCLTKDYFYGICDPAELTDMAEETGGAGTATSSDLNLYQSFSITFLSPVTATNGKIDPANPNRVTWENRDASKKVTLWASTKASTGTAKTTSVKNKKAYNKQKTIKVSNASNLVKMTLSKKDAYGFVTSTKTIKSGAVVKANGFYELTIWSRDGKRQTINFTIDKKKPTISGAKNGKTYKKNVTLKFKDTYSGISSVTVNGKKISSKKYTGYTIKKNGTYKIVVKDKAGNKTTMTIKIKK